MQQTIKVGDKVKISNFDSLQGQIGIVIAVNVKSVPSSDAPLGVYEFDSPRYAVQLEMVYNENGRQLSPDSGKIIYPHMKTHFYKVEVI